MLNLTVLFVVAAIQNFLASFPDRSCHQRFMNALILSAAVIEFTEYVPFLCRYTWKVPRDLATVTCSRCYTSQPAAHVSG